MSNFAWVTLATNDSYSLGALVVAHSLKKVATAHKLVVLITPGVSDSMRSRLEDVFDLVQFVNVLDSKDAANLAVLKRPELGITFTKLHCWNLTQFDKCVFLDADVLVLQNCDELFEREELSAAADVGWPDIFSSGVFVFKPSVDTYGKLIQFAETVGSFDGADQGLLNQYFSDWSTGDSSKRLPFLYNTASTATYSYLPAFKHFNKDIKIIHFIGEQKPWLQQFNSVTKQVQSPMGYNHIQNYLQYWWDIFCEKVYPVLSDTMNIPWLSRFEDNYVEYNYPSNYEAYTNHSDSPATIIDNHNNNFYDEGNQTRAYDPYLIAYHEDTNTFTYTDPWVTIDKSSGNDVDNDSNNYNNNCTNNNNNNNNVEYANSMPTHVHEYSNDHNNSTHIPEITSSSSSTSPLSTSMSSAVEEKSNFQNNSDSIGNNMTVHEKQCFENSNPTHVTIDNNHSPSIVTVKNNSEHMTEERKLVMDSNSSNNKNENGRSMVKGNSNSMRKSGIAGTLANLKLESERTAEQIAYEDQFRRANWESGNIDYLGQDSFDNIWKKIQCTIEAPPAEVVEKQERRRSRSRSKTPQREPSPVKPVEVAAEPVELVEKAVPVKPVPPPTKPVQPTTKPIAPKAPTAPIAPTAVPIAPAISATPIQKQTAPVAPKPVVEEKTSPAITPAVTAPIAPPKKKEGDNNDTQQAEETLDTVKGKKVEEEGKVEQTFQLLEQQEESPSVIESTASESQESFVESAQEQ